MEDRYVDEVMSRPVETVSPDVALSEAADELIRHDVGAVVVVDDTGRIEGLLTATDFVLIVRDGTAAADSTVGEFMRTDLVTTERSAPLAEVVDAMLEHRIHHVPVVEGEGVVGMVSTMDLTAQLAKSQ